MKAKRHGSRAHPDGNRVCVSKHRARAPVVRRSQSKERSRAEREHLHGVEQRGQQRGTCHRAPPPHTPAPARYTRRPSPQGVRVSRLRCHFIFRSLLEWRPRRTAQHTSPAALHNTLHRPPSALHTLDSPCSLHSTLGSPRSHHNMADTTLEGRMAPCTAGRKTPCAPITAARAKS